MIGPSTSREIAWTASKSPGEAIGKPASMMSTPRRASWCAISSFSVSVERDARRLLTVAQRRVEDQYSVRVHGVQLPSVSVLRLLLVIGSRHRGRQRVIPPGGGGEEVEGRARTACRRSVPARFAIAGNLATRPPGTSISSLSDLRVAPRRASLPGEVREHQQDHDHEPAARRQHVDLRRHALARGAEDVERERARLAGGELRDDEVVDRDRERRAVPRPRRPGAISGSVILRIVVSWLAPRSIAASSMWRSMPSSRARIVTTT